MVDENEKILFCIMCKFLFLYFNYFGITVIVCFKMHIVFKEEDECQEKEMQNISRLIDGKSKTIVTIYAN